MKLLDYYKELSYVLERYREENMSFKEAKDRINTINDKAKESKLEVFTDLKILNNVGIYDDERSYEEIEKMKLMGMDSASAESAILGFSVNELAKRFLLNQKLPDAVIDVVVNGHERKNKAENDALLNIVSFAYVIVRAINEERRSLVEVWHESKNFLQELKLDISFDEWNKQIKMIFFHLVKFENEV